MEEESNYYNHPCHVINSIKKHYDIDLDWNERDLIFEEFRKAKERNNSRIERGFFDYLIPINSERIMIEANTNDLIEVADQINEIFDNINHNANTNELSTGKKRTRFSVIILVTLLIVKVKEWLMNLKQIFYWKQSNGCEAIEN